MYKNKFVHFLLIPKVHFCKNYFLLVQCSAFFTMGETYNMPLTLVMNEDPIYLSSHIVSLEENETHMLSSSTEWKLIS